MNLSIRTSLGSINHRTSQILNSLGNNDDLKIQIAEAREQLAENMLMGKELVATLEALDTIKGSLESNGFSDEWFNLVNEDGSFLESINVELVALLGTDEEKGVVCMEGLFAAIGTILKKIWDWIVDMFNRIVGFLSRLIRAWRGDTHIVDKCIKTLEIVTEGETSEEKFARIGKAVNEAGSRGGLNYDMRELISRFCIDMNLATSLCRLPSQVCGTKSPVNSPADLVDSKFLEYCGEGRNPPNAIMKKLMENIESNPAEVTKTNPIVGFNGTRFVDNPRPLKSMLEKAGYSITNNGGTIFFNKGVIDSSIAAIDYSAIFKNADDYKNLLAAWKSVLARSGMENQDGIIKYINESKVFLTQVGVIARGHAANLKNSREMGTGADVNLERGLQKQGQWIAEVVMHISYCVSDMERIRVLCTRIVTKIEDAAKKK